MRRHVLRNTSRACRSLPKALSQGQAFWAKGPTASAKPRGTRASGCSKRDSGACIVGVDEVEVTARLQGVLQIVAQTRSFLNENKPSEATVRTHVLGHVGPNWSDRRGQERRQRRGGESHSGPAVKLASRAFQTAHFVEISTARSLKQSTCEAFAFLEPSSPE